MNVLLIPDSFKDCLPSDKVAAAMRDGVLSIFKDAKTFQIQASDGGEGFLNSVRSYIPSVIEQKSVTVDPLGRDLTTTYLLTADKKSAYIELANASGLELLTKLERSPLNTSTLGTGYQIKSAIDQGVETIYIGLGGSATNDAGIGIAQALGYQFYDAEGRKLAPVGKSLSRIARIEPPDVKSWSGVTLVAVNDVLNPLFGSTGAAYTYGPQKGATTQDVELLDQGLQNLDRMMHKYVINSDAMLPGSGAAGGTAYGLKWFLGAEFVSGVSLILNMARFSEMIISNRIDLIFTGEGKIDSQTAFGKLIHGVVTESAPHGIPVMAVCGKLDLNAKGVKDIGLAAAAQLYDANQTPGYSYEHAYRLIKERTAELLKTSSFGH